jgi:putrescine aminotransferase
MSQINHRALFFDHLAQTSDFPLALEIEKAEGVCMWDTAHKKYIDFISGIGVSNVGHRHPKVVEAIKNQVDSYMHLMVYGEYIQGPQSKLAKALCDTLFFDWHNQASLDNVYFTNSGTEAIEGAMKLAKRFTGRTEFISCFNAYHGASQGALSVSGGENFKRKFRPLLPNCNRINFGSFADINLISTKTACVIIEVVQGEAGVRLAPDGYLEALRAKCNETGTLLLFDEIQTGFGRTGSFWAFEQYQVYPDLLVAAKGMGGGMPIGAFMAPKHIMEVFKNNPILGHITTFGGHPVCTAASLATLEVIQREKLVESVGHKAQLIYNELNSLPIEGFRNKGLLMALDFGSFGRLKPIIDKAIQKGVITDWFLFCDNSMRIAPPITITGDEILEACSYIKEAVAEA